MTPLEQKKQQLRMFKDNYRDYDDNTWLNLPDAVQIVEDLLVSLDALEEIKSHSSKCDVCGASEIADTAIAEVTKGE